MTERENLLRTVRFERPEYIPMAFHLNASCWDRYPRQALVDLMASHPLLFPDFDPVSVPEQPAFPAYARPNEPFTDPWGCVWETTEGGIVGLTTTHALEDWADFDSYTAPNPEETTHWGPIDWAEAGRSGFSYGFTRCLRSGEIGHGHTFLKLIDIRGYENLMYDMADDEPRLWKLIEMIEAFNLALVRNCIEYVKVEWMGYAEDLGMQTGPMLSPDHFRKYIKPSYRRLIAPAREAGCIIHMHSDGDIRQLVDDLVDVGADVLNLQDVVNGIDWIAEHLKGKVCIDLDIDRQSVTRFGTPSEIDDLIRKEVETLGSPSGGLMMIYGLYPGVPLENVQALMDAMERYSTYYS